MCEYLKFKQKWKMADSRSVRNVCGEFIGRNAEIENDTRKIKRMKIDLHTP